MAESRTHQADPLSGEEGGNVKSTPRLLISLEQGILLPVEAAALLLGIGRTTLYELIKRREIAVVRIGRRTLLHRADLEQFAQKRRAG
jgi:excisionase family DNA binding protein